MIYNFYSIHRAMAVCISLMFGRLGGVVGSFTAASLLDNNCETAFYISASTMIGMYESWSMQPFMEKKSPIFLWKKNLLKKKSSFLSVACGFGAFFVKNIHQKGPRPSVKIEPRLSVMSMRGWLVSLRILICNSGLKCIHRLYESSSKIRIKSTNKPKHNLTFCTF